MATGIVPRRTRRCLREHGDGRSCKCDRTYSVWVAGGRRGTKEWQGTYSSEREAKIHRVRVEAGLVQTRAAESSAGQPLLSDAAAAFLEAAERGEAQSRNRVAYK